MRGWKCQRYSGYDCCHPDSASAYTNSNAHTDSNADANPYADSNANANPYADSDADTNADADPCSDSNTYPEGHGDTMAGMWIQLHPYSTQISPNSKVSKRKLSICD